jgi:2-aminoadipate transaminase
MERVGPSAIMELLKTAGTRQAISLASGLPDPSMFPTLALQEIAEKVLSEDAASALQYGPAEGYSPLRDWVAERLRARGFAASVENVLLTSGSQQALDLTARAFLDRGDAVAIESPTYLAALQVFDSYGAEYRQAPHDSEGMVVEHAEAALSSNCKLMFTLPNYQNPTGRTLHLHRRERLGGVLTGCDTLLLEDDAYYDLRYEGSPLPPIGTFMPPERAFYCGTFSKTIAPGLRVGYLFGPAAAIERLTHLKQMSDLHTSSLCQRLVYRFVTEYDFDGQIAHLCSAYGAKRDAMLEALRTHMPGGVVWTHPTGGMFLWLTLPSELDASNLLETALERGLLFVPGQGFHADRTGANTLRLTFVTATMPQIVAGVTILGEILREAIAVG